MISPRLFLCSGLKLPSDDSRVDGRKIIELDGIGHNANINIRLEDVARVFLKHLSPRLVDLIEIASYVYTADCATRRGTEWTDDHSTESWSRDFAFIIPVRDIDFWSKREIKELLAQLLWFLSNDKYSFDFELLQKDRPTQDYLELSDQDDWPFHNVDRVIMFSGGLDSLAGAVTTAASGENLVLVSHRSVGTLSKRQRELFKKLQANFNIPMLHIPVWINKENNLGREHTQRTRSFLYSALGVVISESIKAKGVRFFENGVVSLNLPVADEVLRARASRTTHPLSMVYLSQLFTLLTEREFVVDNPFLFCTKTDVVNEIARHNCAHLIQYTCSCAHTAFKSKNQWHCGTCSQCIDRRIAIIAARQEVYDPDIDYVVDVFLGSREEGYEQNMAVGYARHTIELSKMSDEEMSGKFSLELSRAARPFSNRRDVIQQFVDLHKKHASTVSEVLQGQMQINSSALLKGEVNQNSMLSLIAGREHLTSSWHRYAERIGTLLQVGVPIACKTQKPKNEPHLQEICDGILKAQKNDLVREFPFMRWSASLTKPDWSLGELKLWIELKYVRDKGDIRVITEDISSDITKYGDNGMRVLYVIYDPQHYITDEQVFSEPITSRETMLVTFIR